MREGNNVIEDLGIINHELAQIDLSRDPYCREEILGRTRIVTLRVVFDPLLRLGEVFATTTGFLPARLRITYLPILSEAMSSVSINIDPRNSGMGKQYMLAQ